MFTSEWLQEGHVSTREALQKQFQITDRTLFTDNFRLTGHDFI